MRGLDFRRGNRDRRRTVRRGVFLLCIGMLAALFLGRGVLLAQVAALPRQLDTALAGHFVPQYTAQLNALSAENRTLRTALAAAQPSLQENGALRALLGAGHAENGGTKYSPARLTAWYGDSFTLVCRGNIAVPSGTPVLDKFGRLTGLIERTDCAKSPSGEYIAHCAAAGCGIAALPCFAGGKNTACGTLERHHDGLHLTNLPRHSGLAAGDIVTTAGGLWVGRLGDAPQTDSGGLTAAAPLCETAVTAGDVYFLVV